ncbi:MAG: LamG domain-containing protein, partial [Chloroflexi bacterium]|nr:LamG domain-containing protein [Chloroflexota bacterium]
MFKQQIRKKIIQYRFFLLASIGVLMLLWPSFVTAVPLTTQQKFDTVWTNARDVGQYQFFVSALQTSYPTPRIENVGRGPETTLLTADGIVNVPEDQMELNLWSDDRPIMIRLVEGSAFGRADVDDEWVELEDPNIIFAPGNDVMGFASASVNIQEVENWKEEMELDAVTAVRTSQATALYTFDVSGSRFAEYMRQQAEIQMRNSGDLPPSVELGLAQQYVDMTGQGQLWVNAQGLPVYQALHLEFPTDRGAMESVEADITTEFAGWDNGNALFDQSFSVLPGLLENTTLISSKIQPPTAESLANLSMNFALILIMLSFAVLVIAYRRSPKLYASIALIITLSMVFVPLLQANQVYAFSERQAEAYSEQEAENAKQDAVDQLLQEDDAFNPTIDPLTASNIPANAVGSQEFSMDPASAQDVQPKNTQFLDILSENESVTSSVLLQVTCDLTDSDGDCDGDGLANGVEIFRLGTDPEDIDSDGDQISDRMEVEGFNDGQQWYLNPLDSDTNNDGLIDLVECFGRVDVDADGTFTGVDVSNVDCVDTDGDGAPDVFDYDNDGDQVPDAVDASPNFTGSIVSNPNSVLDINIDGYTTDSTLVVEYQIRPDTPNHLWQTNNSFRWPTDMRGQITIVHDREVTMTPMLEITIPAPGDNSNNRAGSLPILPGKDISDVTTNSTVDEWLDAATLEKYGINVTQSSAGGSLLAYVPLVVVNDPVGDMAVAWSARMVYRPEVANWGNDHEARVVWFISAATDYCDVTDMDNPVTFRNRQGHTVEVTDDKRRREIWCSRSQNWISNGDSVLHTYDDEFTVAGMNFTEYNDVDTAVIAQTDALTVNHEDDMWRLANGLYQSFAHGKVFNANEDRFDIAEVKNRFDNDTADPYTNGDDELWGIDNGQFNVLVDNSSPDLVSALDTLGKVQVHQLLDDTYGASPVANDVVTLLMLREQTTRSTILEDNTAVSVTSGTVSVDLSGQESSTHGSIQWGPYVYDGVDWDPGDIINYLSNDLKTQLDTELLESHITSILGAGESVNNIDNARAGIISLATSYYIGVHQGATSILELGGNLIVDTSSSDVDDYLVNDAALNLGANPAFVGVSNETLLLFQELIEEEMFIEVEGDIVGSPISGALEKIVILESFGSVANATDDGSGDFGTSAIEGSQGVLKKVASLFEKKILKIDEGSTKWQKRSKNAATAINLAVGIVAFVGPDAGLTAGEVLAISLSLEFASELMAIYDTAKTVKQGLVGVKVGYLKNLTVAKKAAKSGAILGLIIDTTIIVGVAIYTILSQDIEPGSIAFNTIIAIAIGQLIVAIISAVIAAIFPIGTLVIAIIGLIDFIIMGICAIIEEVEGDGTISDDVDKWVCGGISGAIAAGITEAIYDNYLTVDLNAENRTQMSLNRPTVNVPDGYIPGTSVELSMEVITTLTLAPIEDGLIKRSFSTSQLRSKMRRSAFGYYLQRNATDHHDELSFGSVSWSNNQHTFNPSITLNFNNAGVNQSRDIYFTESYNVVTLECWGFIFTSSATCDEEPTRDSFHSKLDSVVFDIFPETFEGFINSGGLKTSYQWIRSGHVSDIDGDGLKTYSRDPNPFSADHDGDGLTDLWEKNNGTDAYYADRDGDGLNDYWEVIYGTNPYHRDSDGDGIWDSDEFPRTQVNNPFNADTQPWTGGWTITYDYDANDNPMETWVWANPLSADSDDDGMSDPTERLYGYNPNVASVLNPVSLVSSIETLSVQAGVVGLNDSIAYTATVGNEDQFNTIGGFLNVEIPENDIQATETINPLLPEEKVTFIGTAPTGHISASTNTSVTVRAEVTLDSLVDNVSGSALLDIPLNGEITTGFIANNGSLGNQATCNTSVNTGGCPLFGDKGQVLEAANFNVRYPREIVYPYTSGLDVNNFSMGLWVKPYNAGGNPKLLIGREEYSLSLLSGSVQFSISGNSGASCGTPTTLLTDSKIDRYQWTHIMATYDGSEMKVYINGEEDLNTVTHNG